MRFRQMQPHECSGHEFFVESFQQVLDISGGGGLSAIFGKIASLRYVV